MRGQILYGKWVSLLASIFLEHSIKSLDNYAFYDLNNLTSLAIDGHTLNYIPSHAFDFRQFSNNTLTLYLDHNNLNGSSFGSGAFSNAKRPLSINLRSNKIDYINENVFRPFFSLNVNNKIYIENTNNKYFHRIKFTEI